MNQLIKDIEKCTICEADLPLGPRPVISVSQHSKIIVIGQAPGTAVHKSGIPWDDPSGKNLRNWLGVDEQTFYQPKNFGIMPMGFCYPGKGKSGDLPPRKECAPKWHSPVFEEMKNVELILLIGKYAQDYYLKEQAKKTLTENVKCFKEYLPNYFALPHPSPRNNIWQAKNEWFGIEVIPALQSAVSDILRH